MFAIKTDLVFFLLILRASDCTRRIKDGEIVAVDKKYVVYLVRAPISPRNYDAWLCGGALVTTEFIITSAACVEDVEYLYAIAGYKKYVPDDQIETDPCTKSKKKKVIYTCTPVSYDFKYDRLEKWAYIDIALVKVESPYDFKDATYEVECSYIPTSIVINYEVKYQEPGNDAMVLGWGHKELWRKPGDVQNYNQETLNYASTLIEDKESCKKHYEIYPNMTEVIDQYMICTIAQGNINDAGETILKAPPTAEGCSTTQQKLMGFEGISCEEDEKGPDGVLMDNTRREVMKTNKTLNVSHIDIDSLNRTKVTHRTSVINRSSVINSTTFTNKTSDKTRRHGICQNDHGGPLVTWVGSREVLIGVASVFKVSEESECIGPYLYTSTQCNGAFLSCVLKNSKELPDLKTKSGRRVRDVCDSPPSEKGYDTLERHISWMYHPSGPADNERKAADSKYAPRARNEKFLGSDRYKATSRYPTSVKRTTTINRAVSARYAANAKYAASAKFAASAKYAASAKHAASAKYAAGDKYAARQKYAVPVSENFGSERYAVPASESFGSERYAVPASENFGPEKYAVPASENFGPESYAVPASESFGPENYAVPPSESVGPQKYAVPPSESVGSEKYAALYNYPDNGERYEGNEDEAELYEPNTQNEPKNDPEIFPGFDQYGAIVESPVSGNVAKEQFVMRPQQPLRI